MKTDTYVKNHKYFVVLPNTHTQFHEEGFASMLGVILALKWESLVTGKPLPF